MGKLLVDTLLGTRCSSSPIWLMRQAGRYLPEYRKLRSEAENFLDFCYNPDLAIAATLQPIQRFELDAAILFADILTVPDALGYRVTFPSTGGPRLLPPEMTKSGKPEGLDQSVLELMKEHLSSGRFDDRLKAVGSTVAGVASRLPKNVALIGFAGSPWTVATYMIGQGAGTSHNDLRRYCYDNPDMTAKLIRLLVDATVRYLNMQVQKGAEVLQLFDSWCGMLPDALFDQLVISPTKEIVQRVRLNSPDVPIIGYPRLAGNRYLRYRKATGVDAVSFDETVGLSEVAACGAQWGAVQGNIDSQALVSGGDALDAAIDSVLSAWCNIPHVVNLGHGIVPQTPIQHVQQLIDRVRCSEPEAIK